MSHPSPPELSGAGHRIDSNETIESPFSSNLVTPTDEDPYCGQGIHERLTIAEAVDEYFDSTANDESFKAPNIVSQEHISKGSVDDGEVMKADEGDEVDSETEIKGTRSLGSLNNLSSPPSSFSSMDSFRRARSGSIYNLPNNHIIVVAPPAHASVQMKQDDRDSFGIDSSYRQKYDEYDLEFNSLYALTNAIFQSFWDFFVLGLRILFFLPWCVAIGGALIFFPDCLDMLAFDTGYLEHVTAIHRFSHWATYGFQHVVAFFASLGALLWRYPNVGFAIVGVLLGQFYLVWHDFLFDPTIPLGKDVRHTTYLLFATSWLDSDDLVNIKKVGGAYYWADRFVSDESDAESN